MNTEQTPAAPVAETPTTPEAAPAPARNDGRPPRGGDRGGDRGGARRGGPRGPKPPEKRTMRFDHDPMANMPKLRDLDSAIEAELNAAMSDFQPEKELGALTTQPKPEPSADGKKRGTVLSIHGGDVFIDVPGGRGQGVMSMLQFTETPKVGDVVEFAIEGYDGANGLLKLAKAGAAQIVLDWSGLQVGKVVEARVTGTNKGGLQVEVNGIRGFLPMGQIDTFHIDNPEAFMNQKLLVAITEVNPAERNLVVSRRRLMEIERKQKEAVFWESVVEGEIREGTVKGIKPFGVFVDLGGADGLVPMGELAWARVTSAESVVSPGQQVKVKVMRVDKENRKIGLSLREMSANPFDGVAERVNVGTKVIGKITRIEDFGAFVEIEPGIEGLLHISELGNNRVRRVRDAVKEGQEVEVQVINIDRATRRISLSLKAIANAEMYKAQEEERIENEKYKAGGGTPRAKTEGLRGGITDGGKALLEQLAKKYK